MRNSDGAFFWRSDDWKVQVANDITKEEEKKRSGRKLRKNDAFLCATLEDHTMIRVTKA